MCSADDQFRARLFRRTPERPQERKSVGGLVGFSRNRVAVDPGCECCLALSYLSTVLLLARLLKVTHTVGTRMCYHADSRSFFSLHNIPHGQPQLQSQPQALRLTDRRNNESKQRRFRTAPISSDRPCQASNLTHSSTFCTRSDSPSQPKSQEDDVVMPGT